MAKGRKTGGRTTKLTKAVQERICEAVRTGATYKIASQYGGVSDATFFRWMDRGDREDSGIYCEFRKGVKEAESEGNVYLLATIKKAAITHWQAAAWLMERRYPQQYGRTVREHIGKVENKITLGKGAKDAAEEIAGLLTERASRGRADGDPPTD